MTDFWSERKAQHHYDVGRGALVVPVIPPRHGRQQVRMVQIYWLPDIREWRRWRSRRKKLTFGVISSFNYEKILCTIVYIYSPAVCLWP